MKLLKSRRRLEGSFTVEISFIIPVLLFLIMECILVFFYYHDKNILAGAAYETAVAGSTKAREENKPDEAELEAMFRERIRGKCILFSDGQAKVRITDESVTVQVQAEQRGMRIDLACKAAVTVPEQEIRERNRLRE